MIMNPKSPLPGVPWGEASVMSKVASTPLGVVVGCSRSWNFQVAGEQNDHPNPASKSPWSAGSHVVPAPWVLI
jgi:hypothetical protein